MILEGDKNALRGSAVVRIFLFLKKRSVDSPHGSTPIEHRFFQKKIKFEFQPTLAKFFVF
jgi:hypothetical protein